MAAAARWGALRSRPLPGPGPGRDLFRHLLVRGVGTATLTNRPDFFHSQPVIGCGI